MFRATLSEAQEEIEQKAAKERRQQQQRGVYPLAEGQTAEQKNQNAYSQGGPDGKKVIPKVSPLFLRSHGGLLLEV